VRIAEESGGQPLFVDALVRHRRAGGVDAPLDLEEVLWARARQLEPAALRLLGLLTVAGRPLPQSVAAHATACDFAEYLRQASALRSAHLALTSGPSGVDTVELVHDRLRRAVVRHLGDDERQGWHMRLACSLEALGLGEAATLARHWLGAGQVERAAALYLQAARQAGVALAFSQEASLYSVALGLGRFEQAERRELLVAQAEARARAGTGTEAAAAFLLAAQHADEAVAHVLRRRAAEQYLSCGQVEQGLALVRQVLAEAGLRYPESTLEAIATILRHRLVLALRPLRLRPRAPEQVPAALQRRMDACWELGNVLTPIDVTRGFSLLSCHLRLALQAGDTLRLLRACTAEALSTAATSPRNRPRIAQLMAQLEPLSAQGVDDPFLRCYLHFGPWPSPTA
jgi:eukaryotic-like serine/threonine-protein kinase